ARAARDAPGRTSRWKHGRAVSAGKPPAMLLTVDNVHASYGSDDVLRGVTLAGETGEIVAVLGPNGAGKSTLLKTIAGFLAPREGTIRLDGENVGGLRPRSLLERGGGDVIQRRST